MRGPQPAYPAVVKIEAKTVGIPARRELESFTRRVRRKGSKAVKIVESLVQLEALRASGALTESEFNKAKSRVLGEQSKPDDAPAWMGPAGHYLIYAVFIICGIIGFSKMDEEPIVIAAYVFLNPLFFIGLPLSIYWLHRSNPNK